MLGRKERDQLELFITGSLRQLGPDDHILARVDRVLDLAWLHDEVADLYCADNGRPGIDPEASAQSSARRFASRLSTVPDRAVSTWTSISDASILGSSVSRSQT